MYMLTIDELVANSGNYLLIALVFLVLSNWLKYRRTRLLLTSLVCAGVALVLGMVIKNLFYVPRPYIVSGTTPLIPYLLDGSFPSLHTAIAFGLSLPVFLRERKFGFILVFLSLLTAFSRIIAGVHTLTDVLGGFVISLLISLFSRIDSCHS